MTGTAPTHQDKGSHTIGLKRRNLFISMVDDGCTHSYRGSGVRGLPLPNIAEISKDSRNFRLHKFLTISEIFEICLVKLYYSTISSTSTS